LIGNLRYIDKILSDRKGPMTRRVVSQENLDLSQPIIRKKSLSVRNNGTLKSVVDGGEFGTFITDGPAAHGGTGEGPSPLQVVLGALW